VPLAEVRGFVAISSHDVAGSLFTAVHVVITTLVAAAAAATAAKRSFRFARQGQVRRKQLAVVHATALCKVLISVGGKLTLTSMVPVRGKSLPVNKDARL
jgi:hypothetical protein